MKKTGLWPFFFGLFGALCPPILKRKAPIPKRGQPGILEIQACPDLGVGELPLLAGGLKAHLGVGELLSWPAG